MADDKSSKPTKYVIPPQPDSLPESIYPVTQPEAEKKDK